MRFAASLSPLLFFALLSPVAAINIPFRREPLRRQNANSHSMSMSKSTLGNSSNEVAGFSNIANDRYVGNITVFDLPITVILDTGSNDLWISTLGINFDDIAVTNTSITANITYGVAGDDTSAAGFVIISSVQFSDFNISDVPFIDVQGDVEGLSEPGLSGLLGLGPPTELSATASQISSAGYNGSTLMEQLFAQYDVPAQFSLLLYRDNGTGETVGGEMTIGDPLPGFESVTSQPQLSVVDSLFGGLTHWSVAIDALKINGEWYNETDEGSLNLTGILDSGTPTAFGDPNFVNLMYSNNAGDSVVTDCDVQLNVSFVMGGVEFPIDPIDMVIPSDVVDGTVTCVGAFNSIGNSTPGTFLLGDTFLRNVYTLHNHNGWKKLGDSLPFSQLLSVTDIGNASATFAERNAARLSAFQQAYQSSLNEADFGGALADASAPAPSAVSSADWSALVRNSWIILGLAVAAVVLLIGIVVILVLQRSKASGYRPLGARRGPPAGMSEQRPIFSDAAYQD